jgi:NADH dehydrogenase
MMQAVTFGLLTNNMLTRDQLKNLTHDNVVADGEKGFADLGIAPIAMASILPDYLWRFRPSGQYDAINESAQNLRNG